MLEDRLKTYYDPRSRQGRDRRLSRNAKILLGALAVVAVIGTLMVVTGPGRQPGTTKLIWVAEKTNRAPGAIPVVIRDRIRELGAEGGGRLSVYAVGSRAQHVGSTDLDLKQDGDRVSDSARQTAAVDRKLANISKQMIETAVGEHGFSLYDALRIGADEAARIGAPVEVWLSTTVLSGSTDPLSIAALTKAEVDPSQAVDELMKGALHDLDLSLVDLHLVMLTPVGDDQQALNPRSESWRNTFIKRLGEQLRATVHDPLHDNATRPAWPKSSEVPPIVPMVETTPTPPLPPPVAKGEPAPPPRIDNAAFLPDTATLVDPEATRQAVGQVVEVYKENPGRYRINVVGYCARFGKPDGARRTSRERAHTISALLQRDGIPEADIDADGVGFDELADPTQDPQSPVQRVVIVKLVERP